MEPNDPISQKVLLERLRPLVIKNGAFFRKVQPVLARQVNQPQEVDTITQDGLETVNRARPGDFIVKNMTEAGEKYVLGADKFEEKYKYMGPEQDGWGKYQPLGRVIAIELNAESLKNIGMPEEFKFVASWNESMIAKAGDFLACPADYSEVYRIARQEFFETYAPDE